MKLRARALAMASVVAAAPIAGIVATAAPAAAANCTYPATSSPYSLRISPAQSSPNGTTVVKHGARVVISVRVVKGSLNCASKHVYLYVHGVGERGYHLSKTGTTTDNGLVSFTYNDRQSDFRYYAVLEGTGGSVRSQGGLVQVRG